jgi:hypothetical protein
MTLIELLIVVAISALVMIAFLSIYVTGQKYFFNQSTKADAIEDARVPMHWISRDIHGALQVSPDPVTVDGTGYQTGPNCLVLDVPSLDGAGNIIAGLEDTIIYALDGRRLRRVIVANGPGRQSGNRVMADDVNAFVLAFFKEAPLTGEPQPVANYSETFMVDLTLSSARLGIQRQGQPFVETLNTRVKLRNKT